MTDPPTAAECNTEAEAIAGMVTAARMTRVRAAAKLWLRALLVNEIRTLKVHVTSDSQ